MLPLLLSLFVSATPIDDSITATANEVLRAQSGEMVAITNAGLPYLSARILTLQPSGDDRLLNHGRLVLDRPATHRFDTDVWRLAGPIPFGVIDDAVVVGLHRRAAPIASGIGGENALSTTHVGAWVDRLEFVRWRDEGLDAKRSREIMDYNMAHGSACIPMIDYITGHRSALYDDWDITFDYLYTAPDEAVVLMLRNGQMFRWTLDIEPWVLGEPYNPDWQTHAPFDTNIEGVFRVFMAGPELANHYIIDETGAIFIGCDRDHRQIGTFLQYHSPRETTLTISSKIR